MKRPKLPVVGMTYTTKFYALKMPRGTSRNKVRVLSAIHAPHFEAGVAVTWKLLDCVGCGHKLSPKAVRASTIQGPYDASWLFEWKD